MIVLDASAFIASLAEEKGAEIVDAHLENSFISTVNLTEICTFARGQRMEIYEIEELIKGLSINIIDYDKKQAFLGAKLNEKTKHKGLSLADRACLALALDRDLPVLTADKAWLGLDVGVKIKVVR
jgi:PIN domain nuclease of toxin-antitoxin system